MTRHFTSEEFLQWIAGDRTPEQESHLQSCTDCAAELENVQAPLALFRGAVRDWSAQERTKLVAEERMRLLRETASSQKNVLWHRFAMSAAAVAVAVAIGIGGNSWRQAELTRAAQEDEALLGNVQAKVLRPVPATMQPVYNLMAREYENKDRQ
jgi:anti-sigma factor RsiW